MYDCLGTQFKWKIFLRFGVRFFTLNVSVRRAGERPWCDDARGFRAVSVGSTDG